MRTSDQIWKSHRFSNQSPKNKQAEIIEKPSVYKNRCSDEIFNNESQLRNPIF